MKKMISTTTSEMWKFETAGFFTMVVLLLIVEGTIDSATGSGTESKMKKRYFQIGYIKRLFTFDEKRVH